MEQKMITHMGNANTLVDRWSHYISQILVHESQILEHKSQILRIRGAIKMEIIAFIKEHKTEFIPKIIAKHTRTEPAKMFTMPNPYENYYLDEDTNEFYLDTGKIAGGNALQLKVARQLTEEETHALLDDRIFVEIITASFKNWCY